MYFSFHRDVRLRFELATGLWLAWKRDGGIPKGFPLNMVFTIALFTPWSCHLGSLAGISPELYADNFKCTF